MVRATRTAGPGRAIPATGRGQVGPGPAAARLKTPTSGRLDPGQVRRALNTLGWHATGYIADCIDALLGFVEAAIDPPLNDVEARAFRLYLRKHPAFGGLPYGLLYPRHEQIQWAVVDWLSAPAIAGLGAAGRPVAEGSAAAEREAAAVLHRLLAWYGVAAFNRREADRGSEGAYARSEAALEIATVAGRVRRARGVTCPCGDPVWDDRVLSPELDLEGGVEFTHRCVRTGCGRTTTTAHTVDELRRLMGEG